jgi:ABC-type cobalamin/Fe3+-siderophores transport system ATPase subunit
MAREVQRLSLAFATGDPLLLLGPQGSGKTKLIQEALARNRHVQSHCMGADPAWFTDSYGTGPDRHAP